MSSNKADYIVINEADNVAILRSDTLGFASKGQKVALENIASGALIIKYGVPIAVANSDIQEGDIVSHKDTDELLTTEDDQRMDGRTYKRYVY